MLQKQAVNWLSAEEIIMTWEYSSEYAIKIHINLDVDKGLFYAKKLKYYEEEYLENHGYKSAFFVPIGKIKQEEAWIKITPPESLSHTFLVLNIRDELKKYVDNIRISKTKEPDILFEDRNRRTIALEIETGKGFNKHRERLKEKFEILRKEYKKNVYIILTDANQKSKYQNITSNIKIMTRKDLQAFFESLPR